MYSFLLEKQNIEWPNLKQDTIFIENYKPFSSLLLKKIMLFSFISTTEVIVYVRRKLEEEIV